MRTIGGDAPIEIRTAAALLAGGGALFVLQALMRYLVEGGGAEDFLVPPLLQLAVAIGVAGGVLRGMRTARLAGMLFALLAALLHVLIALSGFPVWVRVVAGVIAASQIYAAVLLNTRPALRHTGTPGVPR